MDMSILEIPDPTRDMSIGDLKDHHLAVMSGWENHWNTVLAPLSPDMLRIIAWRCNTLAEQREPAPVLGAPTFGWHRERLVTRTWGHVGAVNLARAMDERGMSVPQVADELGRLGLARGDGRTTWEERAVARLLERERNRRFIWDREFPRVEGAQR